MMVKVKEVVDSVGYCGLVCRLCHLSDKCSGCKSDNNCCGRHLSDTGCYQYNCCIRKGINGCWECDEFPCSEDMFSESHDLRLRAFIRFIKEEGLDKLAECLVKNQENGTLYGYKKDYDGLESEEAVIKLIKEGRK